jgi:hypothetical protein
MVSKRHKKVLVTGNTDAGKNTFANVLFAYWHQIGREALFTPSMACKKPGDLWTHPNFKNYRGFLATGKPVIVPMKYEQEWYGERHIPGLFASARNFDVLVDCRRLPDGTRMVCQVFVRRGQKWSCLYRSPVFASLQIGRAA